MGRSSRQVSTAHRGAGVGLGVGGAQNLHDLLQNMAAHFPLRTEGKIRVTEEQFKRRPEKQFLQT